MEEKSIMTGGEDFHRAELHGDQCFPELMRETNPDNGEKFVDKDGKQPGPEVTSAGRDIVNHLQHSESRTALAQTIDVQSFREFISHLPTRQLTEFALLLAQRMRDQAEAARLSNPSRNNMRALSGSSLTTPGGPRRGTFSTATTIQGVSSPQIADGWEQPESMLIQPSQQKYIITPHPDQIGRCIKQTVGEPENIPYMPPGVYRQSISGTMELETSFRSSGVRVVSNGAQDAKKTRGVSGLAGSVNGLVKKVGKLFEGKKK